MTKLKLCGMMSEQDIAVVNELRPDYIGFIFWEKSRRNLTEEQAERFRELLDPSIPAVGVFVDETIERIIGLLERGIIDVVQLHGHEDAAYIEELRKHTDRPIFRAYRIRSEEDVKCANASTADEVLVDAGTGCGVAFDWSLLQYMKRPYILAGGLGLDNIGEALKLAPRGVDVSSGIETAGRKDPAKMREFVRLVREADND